MGGLRFVSVVIIKYFLSFCFELGFGLGRGMIKINS